MIERIRSSVVLAVLLILAACAGAPDGPARVTSVATEPGNGFVAVRWEVAGTADRFDVSRAEVGDQADQLDTMELVASIEDGSVRSFEDVDVEPGVSYTYAVSANGGEPVDDGGEGVRPARGNQLQVLFGGPVPEGVTVRSMPAGIQCVTAGSSGCTADFAAILDVEIFVEAAGDVSVTWAGCDNVQTGTCIVSMAETRAVTLAVGSASRTLDVEVDAPGTGRVTNVNDLGANPVVDCSATCGYVYPDGLMIGLRADPIAPDDYRFSSWGGACAGVAGTSCTVTMDESKAVRADFELVPPEIASFEAEPDRIWSHETATLSWNVSGGGYVRVSIVPDVGDVTGRSEIEVSPEESTVYTLTASNDGGTATAAIRVHVRSWPFGSVESAEDVP